MMMSACLEPYPIEPQAGFSHSSTAAQYYARMYRKRADIDYYATLAGAVGGDYLELGCGDGRVLIAAAMRARRACGIDLSSHMLHLCRQRLAQKGPNLEDRVDLVLADVSDFELGNAFDLVAMPYRVFQQMHTLELQFRCLAAVGRHMRKGAMLAFDVFCPRAEPEGTVHDYRYDPALTLDDGRHIQRRYRKRTHDRSAQIYEIEVEFCEDGGTSFTPHWGYRYRCRYFTQFELVHLLACSDFRDVSICGDFAGTPLTQKFGKEFVIQAIKT